MSRRLKELIAREPTSLEEDKLLQLIAELADGGLGQRSEAALDRAWALSEVLLAKTGSAKLRSRAHYCRANIWSSRRHMSADRTEWVWESAAIDGEIVELRRALNEPGFVELQPIERAQLHTNLGNALNHIGRFVEAVESWDRAIATIPNFAMALGNRGYGLTHYARSLYDDGHAPLFLLGAAQGLEAAIAKGSLWDGLGYKAHAKTFKSLRDQIAVRIDLGAVAALDLEGHSLGRSKAERSYRRWCLNNRLFLNPLNDLGAIPIAAHDVLTLPSLVVGLDEGPNPPAVIHYYNALKQEYCSARFALFEGQEAAGLHYSDRGVLLYNTLDYTAFGFGIDRIKLAYRSAYSLFDKMAFLLNVYLSLEHPERQVSFRNLWFKGRKGKDLHEKLDGLPNWPLRGLFWLAKDLFEDDFRQTTEPDAREVYELRNHLEHKFVSVHDELFAAFTAREGEPLPSGRYPIGRLDLERRALRLLKLARAGLIYVSLGLHAEERRRAEKRGPGLIGSMPLEVVRDDWKRTF